LPILKIQFLNAVFWRKNEGKKEKIKSDIHDFEQEILADSYLSNLWVET